MQRLDDRYSVGEQIGRGGVGKVFRGEQTTLQRPVAIKVLRRELSFKPSSVARFKREAYTTSRLNHPNIVTIYDIGQTDDDQPFVVMELLDGETLGQRIRRVGPLSIDDVLDVAQQVIRGMSAGQGVGLVHRDLKPDNIFILNDGLVKVLDFGLATLLGRDKPISPSASVASEHPPLIPAAIDWAHKDETMSEFTQPSDDTVSLESAPEIESDSDSDSSWDASIQLDAVRDGKLTRPGALLGTPRYMSPEQVLGWEVDHRTDLYSFGIILYEALAGHSPFNGQGVSVIMRQHLHTPAPPLSRFCPDAPRDLCRIIARLLAKDPHDRFEDWTALGQALRPLCRTAPGTPSSHDERAPNRHRPKEPFRFLSPFNRNSSQIFFGREADIQNFREVWQHEDTPKILILCGASGVGKSSFLGARINPYLEDTGHQLIHVLGTPTPLEQVKAIALGRLAREGDATGEKPEDTTLLDALTRFQSRLGGATTLILDQLEELFTSGSQKQHARFQVELSSVVLGSEGRIRVLLSIREDFLGQLLRTLHPLPVERISRTLALRPLEASDIRQALRGPGRTGLEVDYAPFTWESDLVEEIVEDLLADPAGEVAPRIQAVGSRLWDMVRDTPLPHTITRRHYRDLLGRAQGILSRILDEAIDAQPVEDRGAAKQLLRALTHLPGSPTSRSVPENILVAFAEERERKIRILSRLENPWRVVHGYTDPRWPDTRTYRIAHESLVLRIQQYGTEASDLNRARQVFAHGLSLWLQGGKRNADLLPDGHFDLVQKNVDDLVLHTRDEMDFYEACIDVLNAGWLERHRMKKRRAVKQRLLIYLVPFIAVVLGFAIGQAPVQFTTWHAAKARISQYLSIPNADLSGVSLQGIELRRLHLIAPDFSHANIRHSVLDESQLTSANFRSAALDGASLTRSDLRGVDLTESTIHETDFGLSDLSSAVVETDTSTASFLGARFDRSTVWLEGPPPGALGPKGTVDGLDLTPVDLSIRFDETADVNLQGLSAVQTHFEGTDLSDVRLDGSDLRWSYLSEINLRGSSLVGALLDGADLRDAILVETEFLHASLRGTDLRNANFSNANLEGADLSESQLCGADFRSANISRVIWTDSTQCASTQWPDGGIPDELSE